MATNQAAWLDGANKPLIVRGANMPQPGPEEVIVKNFAVAINPVDWKMQDGFHLDQVEMPFILGTDVAGMVHEVGSAVENFQKGDRVLAHCTSLMDNKAQSGAFQLFSAVNSKMMSKIPANLNFIDATVLPLAISTAAAGLFSKGNLGIPLPPVSPSAAKKSILVWGGASSVGAVTIQLAKASGVAVVTTASSHNIPTMKSQLGADFAFDYKSATVVDDVVSAVAQLKKDGHDFVGVFDAASLPVSFECIGQIFGKLGSTSLVSTKKLATVLPPSNLPSDVDAKGVFAALLDKDIADGIWAKFVPAGLKSGVLKPLPPASVIGKGLESIQKGMDMNKKGVSFAKIVIEL